MKKIIILFAILFSLVMAKEVNSRTGEITIKHAVNLRAEPNARSAILGTIDKGKVLEYTDVLGYANIDVIKGDSKKTTSDHAGKKGFMWTVCIGLNKVIKYGCTLRSTPEYKNNGTPDDTADDPNFVAKVKMNAAIRIRSFEALWFKVEGGWVSELGVE